MPDARGLCIRDVFLARPFRKISDWPGRRNAAQFDCLPRSGGEGASIGSGRKLHDKLVRLAQLAPDPPKTIPNRRRLEGKVHHVDSAAKRLVWLSGPTPGPEADFY